VRFVEQVGVYFEKILKKFEPKIVDELEYNITALGEIKILKFIRAHSAAEYLAFAVLSIGMAILLASLAVLQGQYKISFGFLGLPLVVMASYFMAIDKRKKQIMKTNELPHIIETIAVAVEAGITFDEALRYVVKNKKGLVRNLFTEAINKIDAGIKREEALKEAGRKSLSRRFEVLIRIINESKNTQTGLKELLIKETEEIMHEKITEKRAKAGTLETKLFFPIFIGLFLPVIVLAALPFITNLQSLKMFGF